MTEGLYLILHKVRGEPAFDIAQRLEHSFADMVDANEPPRDHIWIIPTSGHRAFPCWHIQLDEAGIIRLPDGNLAWGVDDQGYVKGLIPWNPDLRDHYPASEPIAKPVSRHAPVPAIEDFLV